MRFVNGIVVVLASLLVAACGGGGAGAGTSPFTGGGGSGGGTTASAADMSVVLNKTSAQNSGSDTVTVTVTAVDASRNGVQGIPVALSVDNNAVLVAGGTTTDANGQVTGTVTIGADRSNRVITVTATSGSLVRSAAFQVTGAKLQATVLPAVLAPGGAGQIQYRLIDVNSAGMGGQSISVSGAGITSATGTTTTNGDFVFNYTAPATPGNVDITAAAGGVTLVQTVVVQGGAGAIPPVTAGSVSSASVAVDPSVVSVNTATSTTNRAVVRALFRGAANAPIANVRVRFDLAGDLNSIGGTLASGSNIVYSDADGIATTSYVPGTRSSPTDGVTIRACWDYVDFAANVCPNAATKTLTVAAEALSVTIGTDNTISTGAGGLTYVKKFVVLVVDAAGQAKSNVQITPSIDLVRYYKGFYTGPGNWTLTSTVPGGCVNEDTNRNGVLEAGEDINNNGKLDPRKADVAITMTGGSTTNDSGIAFLQIEYPKNVATWLDYSILVTASGVSGTEGRATWSDRLGAAAEEFTATVAPSFRLSPYGTANACTNPN